MGNLHGRVEGMNASAQALLIGSHLVTPFVFHMFIRFHDTTCCQEYDWHFRTDS